MIVPTIISLVLRFLLRKDTLPPSKGSLAIYIVTFFPAFFLSNYLVKIGTTRRDPTTGTLISYGEDLSQTGVTEWCFDILYVTCQLLSFPLVIQTCEMFAGTCQIGSGAFGEWFWWLYMVVRPSSTTFLIGDQTSRSGTDPNVCCLQALVLCNISDVSWTLDTPNIR